MAAKKEDLIGPWKTLNSTYPYRDQWLSLRSDTVLLPNGQTLEPFHTVEVPNSVTVVAISDQGQMILIEQFRQAVQQTMLELPAGNIEVDELPQICARRELLEETGYSGGTWYELGSLFPCASRVASQTWSFLAIGVARTAAPTLDHSEIIRILELPVDEFMGKLRAGLLSLPEASQLGALFLAIMHASASDDPLLKALRF